MRRVAGSTRHSPQPLRPAPADLFKKVPTAGGTP